MRKRRKKYICILFHDWIIKGDTRICRQCKARQVKVWSEDGNNYKWE